MNTYYYTKQDATKWRGDDYGAQTAAQQASEAALPLSDGNISDLATDEEKVLFVKGTNIDMLAETLQSYPEINASKIHFHIGGNQTEKTLKFVRDLLRKGVPSKHIQADILPNNLSFRDQLELSAYHRVAFTQTSEAITGKTATKLAQEVEAKAAVKQAVADLEAQVGDQNFVTIHWGGPVAGETLTDQEIQLHQDVLLHQLKALQERHPNTKFLFLPHGGRSFKQADDPQGLGKQQRAKVFKKALEKALDAENIVFPTNYTATLAFTQQNASRCTRMISTAENLSTIAEQLSVIPEAQRPEVEIMQLPCCKQNNKYWEAMARTKDGWLKGVKNLLLTKPSKVLKNSNALFCFPSCFEDSAVPERKPNQNLGRNLSRANAQSLKI